VSIEIYQLVKKMKKKLRGQKLEESLSELGIAAVLEQY
jgi:hypothetical protein